MLSKAKPKLVFEYSKTPEFKRYYVVGARGGPTPYDVHIDFYSEAPRKLDKQVAGESLPTPKIVTVDRKEQVGVILSFKAAQELYDWLGKMLKKLKEQKAKKPKGEPPKNYAV